MRLLGRDRRVSGALQLELAVGGLLLGPPAIRVFSGLAGRVSVAWASGTAGTYQNYFGTATFVS